MKKFVTLALSFLFIFTLVGCTKKEEAKKEEATDTRNQSYYNTYTGLYDTNIANLTSYDMYKDAHTAEKTYKGTEYPGNKEYLANVKEAYKDSKEKIQAFVDGLKKDTTAQDKDIKKMNEEFITEGENLIQDIDNKMAKLDKITDADYDKSEKDFIKLVEDTVSSDDSSSRKFNDVLKKMDKKLGIDRETIQENNTHKTTK